MIMNNHGMHMAIYTASLISHVFYLSPRLGLSVPHHIVCSTLGYIERLWGFPRSPGDICTRCLDTCPPPDHSPCKTRCNTTPDSPRWWSRRWDRGLSQASPPYWEVLPSFVHSSRHSRHSFKQSQTTWRSTTWGSSWYFHRHYERIKLQDVI